MRNWIVLFLMLVLITYKDIAGKSFTELHYGDTKIYIEGKQEKQEICDILLEYLLMLGAIKHKAIEE